MCICSKTYSTHRLKRNLSQRQFGLSRGHQANAVRNPFSRHQNAKKKKKNFYCIFNPNFYHVTTVFMASKISFRPNLLDLIFFFDFATSMTLFWPPTVVCPKSTKMAEFAFQAHFPVYHMKTFLLKLCQQRLRVRFKGLTQILQPA